MRQVKPLSVKQIDTAKPADKPYRLYDGNGLSLLVSATNKIWHFNYYKPFTKKRTVISLGVYPAVSLAMARAKKDEYHALLAQDIDPQAHRHAQQVQAAQNAQNTFRAVSELWLSHQNYAPNTLDGTWHYLKYAYKFLAKKPITDISTHDILDVCQWCEREHSPLMASGVKTKIAQVLDFALGRRMIEHNIARTIHHSHRTHERGNNPAITNPTDLAKLLKDIEAGKGLTFITKQFLRILPYVFVRPNELASMHMNDLDFDKAQWRYTPAKTQKSTGITLIVPLAPTVLNLIKQTQAYHGQAYVFHSVRRPIGHIEPKHPASWLRRHGYANIQTLHGFRASAKTILEEVLEFDPRFVEMQLGHTVKDMNGTAYNRAKFIAQRTNMMNTWADYLDDLKQNQ